MAQRYHVNKETGTVGKCEAAPGNCPVSDEQNHFTNEKEAHQAKERILTEKYGATATISKEGFRKRETKSPFEAEHMHDSSEHYDTEEKAKKAYEEDFIRKNGNPEYGNIPYTTEEMESAVDEMSEDTIDRIGDEIHDNLNYDAQIINHGSYMSPPEYAEYDLDMDYDDYKFAMKNTVKRLLDNKPNLLDGMMKKTGYPFTDDPKEGAKIITKDLLGLIDQNGHLEIEEPFKEYIEKTGDEDGVENLLTMEDYSEYQFDFTPDVDEEGSNGRGLFKVYAGVNDKALTKLKKKIEADKVEKYG